LRDIKPRWPMAFARFLVKSGFGEDINRFAHARILSIKAAVRVRSASQWPSFHPMTLKAQS